MAPLKRLFVSLWLVAINIVVSTNGEHLRRSSVNASDAEALCNRIISGKDALSCIGMSKDRVVLVTTAQLVYMVAPKALKNESEKLDLGGRVPRKIADLWPLKSVPGKDLVGKFVIRDYMYEHIYFFSSNGSSSQRPDSTLNVVQFKNTAQLAHSKAFNARHKWLSSIEPFTVYSVYRRMKKFWAFQKYGIPVKHGGAFDFEMPLLRGNALNLCFQSSAQKQVLFSESECQHPVAWPISTGFFGSRQVYLFGTDLYVYIFPKKTFDKPQVYAGSFSRVSFANFFSCSPHSHPIDHLLIAVIVLFVFCLFGPLSLCILTHVCIGPPRRAIGKVVNFTTVPKKSKTRNKDRTSARSPNAESPAAGTETGGAGKTTKSRMEQVEALNQPSTSKAADMK